MKSNSLSFCTLFNVCCYVLCKTLGYFVHAHWHIVYLKFIKQPAPLYPPTSILSLSLSCLYLMRDQHALSGLYLCVAAAVLASKLGELDYACRTPCNSFPQFFIAQNVPINLWMTNFLKTCSYPPSPISLLWKDLCCRSLIHNCKKLLSGISINILSDIPYIHLVLFPMMNKSGKMGHFNVPKIDCPFLKNYGNSSQTAIILHHGWFLILLSICNFLFRAWVPRKTVLT